MQYGRIAAIGFSLALMTSCSTGYRIIARRFDNSVAFDVVRPGSFWRGEAYAPDACPTYVRVEDETSREIQWEITAVDAGQCLDVPIIYGRNSRGASVGVNPKRLDENKLYEIGISFSGGAGGTDFVMSRLR